MVVLEELIFNSFYIWVDVMVLEEMNFKSLYIWEDVVVLKEVILTVSIFG